MVGILVTGLVPRNSCGWDTYELYHVVVILVVATWTREYLSYVNVWVKSEILELKNFCYTITAYMNLIKQISHINHSSIRDNVYSGKTLQIQRMKNPKIL